METCIPQADLFSVENIRNCEKYVISMQKRLDEAVANNDHKGIRNLFNILVRRSRAVKILAIYRITYLNKGKNTAGVDGEALPQNTKENTDKIRQKLLSEINISKTPDAIRRVYIPKPNGKKRPLGIPTLKDRIIQEIVRIALEPIAEYHFHDNSYGFRPKRSCHDAIDGLRKYLAQSNRKTYIIEGDIKSCFDNISHNNIKETLRKWKIPNYAINLIRNMLKSKIFEKGKLHEIEQGTPQGGVISPLLANIALTGFDDYISQKYGALSYQGGKNFISPMIRYADDFVIVCRSKFQAKMIKEDAKEYLSSNVDLTLSDEKTCITHIKKGFDFLGFTFKKHVKLGVKNPKGMKDYKLLITPSRESVINILRNCKEVIDKNKASSQEVLIKLLNPKLRGWCYFYKFVNSKLTFGKINYAMWHKLRRWSRRKHRNKSEKWIFENLYKTEGNSLYFATDDLSLIQTTKILIENHPKVAKGRRVYCKDDTDYWEKREKKLMYKKLFNRNKILYQKQKGICPECNNSFTLEDNLHIHHIIPKALGGNDSYSNLQLLHAECHRELHSKRGYGVSSVTHPTANRDSQVRDLLSPIEI